MDLLNELVYTLEYGFESVKEVRLRQVKNCTFSIILSSQALTPNMNCERSVNDVCIFPFAWTKILFLRLSVNQL